MELVPLHIVSFALLVHLKYPYQSLFSSSCLMYFTNIYSYAMVEVYMFPFVP